MRFNFGPAGQLHGLLLMFLVLFCTTGIGNGSTFRMIPVIFPGQKLPPPAAGNDEPRRLIKDSGNTEGRLPLVCFGALGAYGGSSFQELWQLYRVQVD